MIIHKRGTTNTIAISSAARAGRITSPLPAAVRFKWRSSAAVKALARSESEPKWIKQPNGDSKLLNPEAMIVHAFTEPMRIICNQWGEILDHLENGQELKITYGQGPWPLGPAPDVADRALVVGLHGDDGPGGAA